MTPDCTVRVEAGAPLAEAVAQGGVVCLGPGVHAGPVLVGRSVTIRGETGAVIDAGGSGSAVEVDGAALIVAIEGLELRGGHGDGGGGLRLTGHSDVTLVRCVVANNRASQGPGGGVYASRGRLVLEDTVVRDNRAQTASELMATGIAEVRVRGGELLGDVAAREGARLTLVGTHVGGDVDVRGTTTRAPTLELHGCTVDGAVRNDKALPAKVVLTP
jgi:nitrous oxidase accessory protein NosD